MKQIFLKILIFLLLISQLSGCSQPTTAASKDLEQNFATAIPIADMNKSLQIILNPRVTSLKADSTIEFEIYNKSPNYLHLNYVTDIKLLGSPDRIHWMELKNGFTYAASEVTLSPEGTPLLDDQHGWAIPILDPTYFKMDRANLVRIVVIGEIMEGDDLTGEKVGAYIDVVIEP